MLKSTKPARCLCGGQTLTFKNRRSSWGVCCIDCGDGLLGFRSAEEAMQAWAEEVVRRGREARKRN